MMRTTILVLAPLAFGCNSSGSPLEESGPQVELTSNPGGVAGHPQFALSLTTWVHLHALGDAASSGQLEATLDGSALVLDPAGTGYFGNGDNFTANFVMPTAHPALPAPATSTVTITDQQTTWTVQIPALFANDLALVGPMLASAANTAQWPSAATADPWSTIDFACIEVEQHTAACHGTENADPGIDVAHEYVQIDVPANIGDHFTLWAQRRSSPQATGDGPVFFVSILDQVTGTFE